MAIQEDLGVIRAESRLYRTPAFPPGSGPDFINAALAVETELSAQDLMTGLHAIEARLGRERRKRWAPRTLDLDLVGYGDQVLPDLQTYARWAELPLERQMQDAPDQLILPHPRLAERAFVLVPLCDVAPEWRHPVTGRTVREMLSELSPQSVSEVVAL